MTEELNVHDVMAGLLTMDNDPTIKRTKFAIYLEEDDYFKIGGKYVGGRWENLYTPSKQGLLRIANAASMETISSDAVHIGERMWKGSCELSWLKPSGDKKNEIATKEIDLRHEGTRWTKEYRKHLDAMLKAVQKEVGFSFSERELFKPENIADIEFAYSRKEPDSFELFKFKARRMANSAIDQLAQFGAELAESGALLRAIRRFMQIKTYTLDEIQWPFIIYATRIDPNGIIQEFGEAVAEKIRLKMLSDNLGIDVALLAATTQSHQEDDPNIITITPVPITAPKNIFEDLYVGTKVLTEAQSIAAKMSVELDILSNALFDRNFNLLTKGLAMLFCSYYENYIIIRADETLDKDTKTAKIKDLKGEIKECAKNHQLYSK